MKSLAETLNELTWGGAHATQYAMEMKSKPSAAETAAQQAAAADRAEKAKQVDAVNQNTSDTDGATVQDTSMYKRTMSEATDDTAAAYKSVRANRSARARMSGIGYAQPIANADNTTTDALEAQDLGKLPMQTADMVQGHREQSAGIHAGVAGMESASAAGNQQQWGSLEQARKAARMKMWTNVAKLGIGVAAAPFTGGMSVLGAAQQSTNG